MELEWSFARVLLFFDPRYHAFKGSYDFEAKKSHFHPFPPSGFGAQCFWFFVWNISLRLNPFRKPVGVGLKEEALAAAASATLQVTVGWEVGGWGIVITA